ALLEANINLLAYHLPLDVHFTVGNNRYLCDLIGLDEVDYIQKGDPRSIALKGILPEPLSIAQIGRKLSEALQTRVDVLGECDEELLLSEIAVCSGSGSFLVDNNPKTDFHALITGDVNEQTYHLAKESGTTVFAVGHHASEQGGVKRLGDHLARKFDLEHHHLRFNMEKEVISFNGN
ncbi:MAG: Nif3-like dinuclear metal center hexameric protein, partial [Succinivibrio sp.]